MDSQENLHQQEDSSDSKAHQSVNDLFPSVLPSKEEFHKHLDHLEFFQRKILIIVKRNELDATLIDILSDFFILKDETKNFQNLSYEMLESIIFWRRTQ